MRYFQNIERAFTNNLREFCQVRPDDVVIVGVSGGPDSLVLLDLLLKARQPVIVGHFDHHLRAESSMDADYVQKIANERNLHCRVGSEDVRAYSSSQKTTIEESARILRYQFLFSLADEYHARHIAVGHNADDQVETVLMHLIRGSGLSGLAGMQYRQVLTTFSKTAALIRPLLDTWRDDIDAYCLENDITAVIDKTNADTAYFRNRLRNDLIPYLQSYNPKVKNAVQKLAKITAVDLAYIQESVIQKFDQAVTHQSENAVSVSKKAFLNSDQSLQLNMLVHILQQLSGSQGDYDFDLLNKALFYIMKPPKSRQCHLYGAIWLQVGETEFTLSVGKSSPLLEDTNILQTTDNFSAVFEPGKAVDLHGYRLISQIQLVNTSILSLASKFTAVLDADKLTGDLSVKNRKPGSRFMPIGMGGKTTKISDYFINQKVPVQYRQKYPLIYAGDTIAWVPGYQIAECYKVDETTQRVLILLITRTN